MTTSPYDILCLPPDASADQIRQAFRDLAKHYHPDAVGNRDNEAAQVFSGQMDTVYVSPELSSGDDFLRRLSESVNGSHSICDLKKDPALLEKSLNRLLLMAGR